MHFPTSCREEGLTEKGETVSKKKIVVINLSEKLIIALVIQVLIAFKFLFLIAIKELLKVFYHALL